MTCYGLWMRRHKLKFGLLRVYPWILLNLSILLGQFCAAQEEAMLCFVLLA